MPSVIASMTGVRIKSDFFTAAPTFELFPLNQRAALLYGRNGCGKSTVAQGFREYIEPVEPRRVELSPMASSIKIDAPSGHKGKFFVFDEDYVAKRIRVKADGLDAIVLFGEQIELDEQIAKTEAEITVKRDELDRQEKECAKFNATTNVIAPDYWQNQIRTELKNDTGWANNGARIKGQKQNLSVTDEVIERIGQLSPARTQAELQGEFDRRYAQFTTTAKTTATVPTPILPISITGDMGQQATELLSKVVPRPQWNEREQKIFNLLGGQGLDTAKLFLSNAETTICNKCLQPVSEEYRITVLHELDCLLNRDVEEFREALREMLLPEALNTAYEAYRELTTYSAVRDCLDIYITTVSAHNAAVKTKIDNPFDPQEYNITIGVMATNEALNQALIALEADRVNYNRIISQRDEVVTELMTLNDSLAHHAIKGMYGSLHTQRETKTAADKRLVQQKTMLQSLIDHKERLVAQQNNFVIAADKINQSLEYIFCCKRRLKLVLGDNKQYHLKVKGRAVPPSKVSCGERNALALSYFFTEIANNTNVSAVYADEVFLVIDDPVSSFDFENRIGVQSLLRWKLGQVLEGCATSKILIMTHDIGTAFDLEKGLKEIKDRLKNAKPADYQLLRLEDDTVTKLHDNQRNEYTLMLGRIFEYAKTGVDDGLVIGNIMRRVLEAFATFSYKAGIDNISSKDSILSILPGSLREYFKNRMYRLVLHGESHSMERILSMKDYDFSFLLSEEEKKRTARDILCFMYLLNKHHVLSHLPLSSEPDITGWISNISPTPCVE